MRGGALRGSQGHFMKGWCRGLQTRFYKPFGEVPLSLCSQAESNIEPSLVLQDPEGCPKGAVWWHADP